MRDRVARLRFWLLGSAVFLVLVIAAFIGYARLTARLRHFRIPAKLGLDVQSDANGLTKSHSDKGRLIYTIHADKQIGFKNGKMQLHDVSIVLYGKQGNRHDYICGQDFEYDEKTGVVRALGLVHIDLQAASTSSAAAKGNAGAVQGGVKKPGSPCSTGDEPGSRVLHVTTSHLLYLSNLGVAATSEYIEFETGGMKGHATGADYSSDTGVLMLQSAVSMSGIAGGRPVSVEAATAEFDDRDQVALLTHVTYASPGRMAQADKATLHTRPDGTLARVEGQGNVTIQENGGTVVSQSADAMLNAKSQPESVLLTGGVQYSLQQALRRAKGQAEQAAIAFDQEATPQPVHAVLTGAVHIAERTRPKEAPGDTWSVRDLTAAKVDAVLAPAAGGSSQLRNADATGNAHLAMTSEGTHADAGRTDVSADDLRAVLRNAADAKRQPELETVAGRGHTVLRQMSAAGVEQTSTGDALDATFRAEKNGPQSSGKNTEGLADTLASAAQQGHVTMLRRTPAKSAGGKSTSAGEQVQHAVAERAAYDGDADRLTLTGGVRVTDADSVLWANQVALDRATGDSQATGAVKVDYVQQASAQATGGHAAPGNGAPQAKPVEPTHVLADRAELEHASSVATFYGKPVRLWQGGSQVQAPVIELAQEQKRLIARGDSGTGWGAGPQEAQVHTVLMNEAAGGVQAPAPAKGTAACVSASGAAGKAGVDKAGVAAGAPQVVRVASGGLVYSGILRQADFTGGVRAETPDATIKANAATAYLQQSKALNGAGAGLSPGGGVERVVADGRIDLQWPGLEATGGRLLYTAKDETYLLTGEGKTPPRAVSGQGTTTGAALRFRRSCDDSVEALSEVPGEPVQRVRTESRVNGDRKKDQESK